MKKNPKHIVYFAILLLIFLPLTQQVFQIFSVGELKGGFKTATPPVFSWAAWFDESYQHQADAYYNENLGFRNFFVRLHNQIDFSLFDEGNAEGIVIGKEDYLFEYDYIRAFTGLDFIGRKTLDRKIRRLKFLQEHLKNQFDIDLILVLEPGKASFFSEYIPERYLKDKSGPTNYEVIAKLSKQYEIDHIDLNKYFLEIKDTVRYPLFPQYGIHWNDYGMLVAFDSILTYIETCRKIDLPKLAYDSVEFTDNLRHPDYDIGNAMNLLWKLPTYKMAYPEFKVSNNSLKDGINLLTIGDSYYWNIFNKTIKTKIFNKNKFWYFYKIVYPDTHSDTVVVNSNELKDEIEKQDVILLMMTERFLYKFAWGFIDDLYKIYGKTWAYEKVIENETKIKSTDPWFNNILQQTRKSKLSLEQTIQSNAIYQLRIQDFETAIRILGADIFIDNILEDESWLKNIEKKASEQDISVDSMIKVDALWLFQKSYPELYLENIAAKAIKRQYRTDSLLLRDLQLKYKDYYLPDSEAIQIETIEVLSKTGDLRID